MAIIDNICLPQELHDLIIDELGLTIAELPESRRALLNCSLVCRSFHHRTLAHLFSNIQITKNGGQRAHLATAMRIERLHDLMTKNTAIAPRVKSFSIDTWFNPNTQLVERRLIFANDYLPEILSKMSYIQNFSWANRRGMLPWTFFDDRFSAAIRDLCTTPSLKSLTLECITGVPFTFFTQSQNLKHLHLIHVEPSSSNPPSTVLTTSHPQDNTIQLQSLVTCYASQMLSAIAHGDINASSLFSTLRDLRVWMRHNAEVEAAWSIMQAASATLETLDITELSHLPYVAGPVNLGALENLRTVKMKCRLASGDHVIFPMSICGILTPYQTYSNVENIDITIDWVDCRIGGEQARFDEPGWSALDDILSRPTYRNLKEVSITLKMGYIWSGSSPAQVERVKRLVQKLAMRTLPRLSLLSIQLKISIDIYNGVYY